MQPSGAGALILAYAAVSALWIQVSDGLVSWLFPDPVALARAQTLKGWFFVTVTSVLGYVVLKRIHDAREKAWRAEAQAAGLLQALVEHSSDAIFAKDRSGRYLLFNSGATRITGRTAHQVIGHDDGAVFTPEQAAMVRANDERVMAQARAETFEEELDTADGRRVFLATKGPLQGADGVVAGTFGISRDITAMAQARRDLAERERRYRTLFEAHPHPLWVYDRATLAFVDVNPAAIASYGFTREEFLAMTLADIRPPEHRAALRRELSSSMASARFGRVITGPWVHRRRDGSLIEVEIAANDIEVDGRQARLVLALDVTERQRLQRERDQAFQVLSRREGELAQSELRYRLASKGGHVWDWDIESGQGQYPDAFWQRLGHPSPPRETAVAFLLGIIDPEDVERLRGAMRNHLKAREPYDEEFRVRDANGSWRWFHTRGQAVWDDAGRATYMAGTAFEVTDRHRAEDALLRTQQELSELAQQLLTQERETTTRLAQVLHDQIGQTLGGLRLQIDLAIARLGSVDPAERLQRASTYVDAAIADVRHLLVELRPPLLRENGLAAALENEIQRGLGRDAELTQRLHAGGPARDARWPDDVEYAAYMIAREAMANALRHAEARAVTVALDGDDRTLDLSVRDDGRGIADEERAGRPGHLGLVGMRERAIAIGARLEVQRHPAGGTEVRLRWQAH